MIEKLITIAYGIFGFIILVGFVVYMYQNIRDGLNNWK